jgi:hypothetical protein
MVVMVMVVVVCTVGHHCRCCRPFGPSRVWRFYKLVIHVDSLFCLCFIQFIKCPKTKYTEITVWLAKQSAQKQKNHTTQKIFKASQTFEKRKNGFLFMQAGVEH